MKEVLKKTVNALSAGYNYMCSLVTRKASISLMPVAVSIELTNNCNLHCPECSSGSGVMNRNRGFIDKSLFNRIIDELSPYIYNLNLYFQGEPMLHPDFFYFVERCRGLNTIVSTNGHFLSHENATRLVNSGLGTLIISLDGMDASTYSRYRINGDFEKVIEGINNVSEVLRKNSSSVKVIIQFLVNRYNEHQIEEVKTFAKRMSMSLSLKSMQVNSKGRIELWMPSGKRFRRYIKINNRYEIRSSLPDRCPRLWFNPVITWDGKVLPCCFDKDADYVMGNMNEKTFSEIWNGYEYNLFRNSLLKDRSRKDICTNCTSGLRGVEY